MDPPTTKAIESAISTLQPIRDLSRNWDVDIASCLEEYLQELVGLSGSQLQQVKDISSKRDSQGDVPNFAQAAIILQNSSNVYSRKVEYLHGLVYKALYEFFKATSGNSKETRRKSADASIDDFYDFDPNEDFLLLDDVVPEDYTNEKINLKEKEDDIDLSSTSSTPINQSLTRTRLSLGGLSVTRADQRSSLGGIRSSSSQQRALLGTLNNGSLRLVDGLCDVGADGVLMMPGSQPSVPQREEIGDSVGQGRSLFGEEATAPAELAFENVDDDDHSNDGPGFSMNYDDDANDGINNNINTKEIEVCLANQQDSDPTKRVTFAAVPEKSKTIDPWALLDPHSNPGSIPRPLKRGKTYRLPTGITHPPSECVTGASTRPTATRYKPEAKKESADTFILESFKYLIGQREDEPRISVDGFVFGDEFRYIAKATAKDRAAKKREEKILLRQAEINIQPSSYDENDDDECAGFDFGGDDDNDCDDYNDAGNNGMASLDEVYQRAHENDETNLGKTFEELCKAHIQAFAKGAEDYAFNTKLSDRVSKWQSKLAPILEEEERRAAFDIHRYSEDLLITAKHGIQRSKRKSDGSQHAASTSIDFETVTKNCTQSDVCRLFLASLSLANSGNISIREGESGYSFDLISGQVERPMESYRAPSVMELAS